MNNLSINARFIEVFNDMFQQRGYDERSLNASRKPGLLIEELKELLLQNTIDNFWVKGPVMFFTEAIGYFDKGRDKILFTFEFALDMSKPFLLLANLYAQFEEKKLFYIINSTRPAGLPLSHHVYQEFQRLKELQRITEIREAKQNKGPRLK